jgi:hypothetical protein
LLNSFLPNHFHQEARNGFKGITSFPDPGSAENQDLMIFTKAQKLAQIKSTPSLAEVGVFQTPTYLLQNMSGVMWPGLSSLKRPQQSGATYRIEAEKTILPHGLGDLSRNSCTLGRPPINIQIYCPWFVVLSQSTCQITQYMTFVNDLSRAFTFSGIKDLLTPPLL